MSSLLNEFSGATAAFLMGLFSTVHCVGMCGGIMGVMALNVPKGAAAPASQRFAFLLAYNVGRISTYALMGALAAGFAQAFSSWASPSYGHTVLALVAAAWMLAMGLYVAGWWPGFAKVERIGQPIWRYLAPLGRRFLPPRNTAQALMMGGIWGWLPCGMVYAVLALATASGDYRAGFVFMLSFGLGTLPGVMSAGMAVGFSAAHLQRPQIRKLAGVLMMVLALATLLFPVLYTGHAEHQNTGGGEHKHHLH